MLYWLRSLDGNTAIYLGDKDTFHVGRKDCEIVITNDQSISRQHAVFTLTSDGVKLEDKKSKYGTYVNNTQLKPSEAVDLNIGNEIKFGKLQSVFTLERIKIAVVTSNLRKAEKKVVVDNVLALKGTVLDTWKPDCTTLVVKEIMLTPKVLTCIVWGTPIVTPKYFVDFLKNARANIRPPDPKNYIPPCGEAVLPKKSVSLDFNPARQTLFANKVFVFSNNAIWNQMTDLIQAAGGKSILFDGRNVTLSKLKRPSVEYLFLNDGEGFDKNEKIRPILDYLASINHRVIPLQEIALAIMQGSCSKDCNPTFQKAEKLLEKADENFSCGDALVLSTQTQMTEDVEIKIEEESVVPPSYENPITVDCVLVSGGVKRGADELKRPDVGAKVSKIAAATDVHQKQPVRKAPSSKKLTQPSIANFVQINKPESSLSITSTNKAAENPLKRKIVNTEKSVINPKMVIEIDDDDDEEENIFKKPKIEKEKSSKVSKNTKQSTSNVFSSTVLSQNDNKPSFYSLDMSTIKPEKVSDNNRPSITVSRKKNNVTSSAKKIDLEPDLEAFINSFKNTCVVKIKNRLAPEKSMVSVNDSGISSNYSTGGINFKKFRKNSQICYQSTIIPKSSFQRVTVTV